MTTCRNCHNQFEGNYCNLCGQKAVTGKLNLHYVAHELQHGLLHIDKGLFYTLRELFTRPGHAIAEYLDGKRIKHFKPISMLLVLAGAYGLLHFYFGIELVNTLVKEDQMKVYNQITGWMNSHSTLVELIMLPMYTLASWVIYRKAGYNLVEHFVINSFISCQRIVITLASIPVMLIYSGIPRLLPVTYLISAISLGMYIWTFVQLFRSRSLAFSIARSIVAYLLALVQLFFVVAVAGVILTNIRQ